jgi:hypothetical protein
MSTEDVQQKVKANKDEKWTPLIEQAEAEIKRLHRRIYTLRKSLIFFRKQADSGVQFPIKKA